MSFRPVVVLPSFNSGSQLARTLRAARAECSKVWVVVDGSTDGSDREAEALGLEGVRFLRLEKNSGKGGAVLAALREASREGFTHLLAMDADGQHPQSEIEGLKEKISLNLADVVWGERVNHNSMNTPKALMGSVTKTFTAWLGRLIFKSHLGKYLKGKAAQ
jgi:glycosyltransferase involved in cell wall biosynthesis